MSRSLTADMREALRIEQAERSTGLSTFALLAGRALFAAIFILQAPSHFDAATVAYAAAHGVPMAGVLVPASGLLAMIGGFSVLLGVRTRIGAWLLVLFLVPVTLTMHAFWKIADPMEAQLQRIMFLKNLSMLGGALILTWFGSGPGSVYRIRKPERER